MQSSASGDLIPAFEDTFELKAFKTYLESLLPLLVSATDQQIALLFAQADFADKATRWGKEEQTKAIYIHKCRAQSDQDEPTFFFTLTTEMTYNQTQVSTLALIKRMPSSIDTTRPLDSQIHVLNLFGPASADALPVTASDTPTANPYETLHSLVHLAVAPFFDAYVNSKSGKRSQLESNTKSKDADAKTGIPVTKKKLAELELSLLHLQQNVEVPDIHLSVHPLIQRTVDRCHTDGHKVSPEALDAGTISDSTFLNKIQSEVNSWIKEIQNVTKLNREVASGTASQEINFWLSMERALEGIDEQLQSDPIVLTLDILRHAKRFQATVSFVADTGLKEATDMVHKYNLLMKDFPLNELLAATDLEKIQDSLVLIFSHINKKLKVSPYPIRRALPLVEAISRDLNDQLARVLSSLRLMYLDYEPFERTMSAAATVFQTWDESIKEFTNVAREVTRKRSEKFIPIKIAPAHAKLQSRITYLRQFRKQHEQLRQMLSPTKGLIGVGMIELNKSSELADGANDNGYAELEVEEEVRLAYEAVKGIEVLDISDEGTEIWIAAEGTYNEKVSRVENQIIGQLREHLGAARNAAAMFRVFSKFNALFVRPRIRGAIQEWQTQLIDSVKDDIRKLQDKFKISYRNSEAFQSSQLRDIPPISGAIIWAKQIERQLYSRMRRVEDVLGKGWELYADGQKLQAESASFRRKLDTQPIFDAWLVEINRRDLQIYGRLFEISKNRAKGGLLQLGINFDPQIITLFKEARNLIWLGFQVPHTINNIAKDARRVYPHAVSLMETVRTYQQTVDRVAANPFIAPLVVDFRNSAQEMIAKGMNYRWEHFTTFMTATPDAGGIGTREGRHALFVKEFASVVSVFQDRCDALVKMSEELEKSIDELFTSPFTADAFSAPLADIQKTIDQLSLEGYANLESWVADLDARIEEILLSRLENTISLFCDKISGHAAQTPEGDFRFPTLVYEVKIQNQFIYLDPPVEHARASWYNILQSWLGVICNLTRIQASRYELSRIDQAALARPFTLIESQVSELSHYVDKWLHFQSLWDLEADVVYSQLGDSLALWQQLLQEIRKTRATFDVSETERQFANGIAVVKYEQVQAKVNAKYDAWQRDILSKFGQKLGVAMRDMHTTIVKARQELERHSIDASSTAQAVSFITYVQDLDAKLEAWKERIEVLGPGQRTLERQRFQFPSDWLYVDAIDGEWSSFNDILSRHRNSIEEQFAGLQVKILAEDRNVQQKIADLVREWDQDKPIQGSLKADNAIQTVQAFEVRVNRLKEEHDMVVRAKEALKLESKANDQLDPVVEEIRDLKAVWTALSGIWTSISDLRDTLWSSLQPRKLRQSLDTLLASTREMPSKMRQYAAFEYVQETLRGYLKANSIVGELKSDAMRERHWRALFKALRLTSAYTPSSMTLGTIWDMDLKRNEAPVKEVVVRAQGELALEEFLKQIKDVWTNYSLDLVNYQQKTRLIRGWDDLFAKCQENLSSVNAMKLSPYFKVFEDEALSWEDKLNRIHVLFDVWIDVQRQWVYLEGIFSGSADIKNLLPVETQRFNNIDTEFLSVMKKVLKSPFVLDVLQIPNIQKSLERLADLLSKIQKALGEYLERERSNFPRFYFVGDEDLLEIIGNSKDILRVCKHLRKMFAGIASLELDDALTEIQGMSSAEGESVRFSRAISLAQHPRINEWLGSVEREMRTSLASLLTAAMEDLRAFYTSAQSAKQNLLTWIQKYPDQLVILAIQIQWTSLTEEALTAGSFDSILSTIVRCLDLLADAVLEPLPTTDRRKVEHVITELVHQRDVVRDLAAQEVASPKDFKWIYHMRFYHSSERNEVEVAMADNAFLYGWEYLGLTDRLVQTPLTDKCFATLTMALADRLGGSPFGPAGTGKTESVKALGVQLGRFVLVFCCDETFDFQAMGRIFVGLCQVGAWGCFDEFNRLDERILSAVSQQIQSIQIGLSELLKDRQSTIELIGRTLSVNPDTGIFITMNPGYAGRSNLPDNLKKLFRSMAMTRPDLELISQVMLFSQGFRAAEALAAKMVPLFKLCQEQLSRQPHYDFGLRALKAVLVNAGHIKRHRMLSGDAGTLSTTVQEEQELLIQSVSETITPKLIAEDVPLLSHLLADVFPGVQPASGDLAKLASCVEEVCQSMDLQPGGHWVNKILQLYQIQNIQHGIMLVGPSATGKTSAWKVLTAALEKFTGVESVSYVIEPKAISKEELYGHLDNTTREWTDGLFTHILRKIIDNVRGEDTKRHWIVFDGDVDPEWVENLNSVLDDNKLLTLPNGERLAFPSNVRILFEVETLKHATLATVSRCGMIWFSNDTLSPDMIVQHHLNLLASKPLELIEESTLTGTSNLPVQQLVCKALAPILTGTDTIVGRLLEFSSQQDHIMDFTPMRAIASLFALLSKVVRAVLEYNVSHPDFPLTEEQINRFAVKRLALAVVWSFTGDSKLEVRRSMGKFLQDTCGIDLPSGASSMIDFDVHLTTGEWVSWQQAVPSIEIETHQVTASDVVIPTLDTVRHEDVLYSWLEEHKPLLLCGPPGSGKTMTLFAALRKLPSLEVIGLNFSSATSVDLIMKTFEQHCEYRKTPNGTVLSPIAIGKWLVLFCDEINLPSQDKYATQKVIAFLRQLVEQGGFWRTSDQGWVTLERIQFVGACNPPTDPGRVPLSHRFLRHVPLVMVDYPGEVSLKQIYSTFNRAVLKVIPNLRNFAEPLTDAMVDFYLASQTRFTPDVQSHYVYSPRELSRWVRGIYESIRPLETLSLEGLLRVWAHEALRLFQDRLVREDEKAWTDAKIDEIALRHFPTLIASEALARPILFSNWTSRNYVSIDREELREFAKARLKVFYEEELDVPLVLFNDVLDHVLRIDRVFRQVQGHVLLIGVSGSGKTTLSRFVAWMNGLSIFQIKVSNKYTGEDFDEDLRAVLRRAGCKGEKICFIMDESNVLDSGFLERMNTLLANAEVPGLFEGDEFASLMTACKDGSAREGLMLDTPEELYKWFTRQVARNLHVVFTMNPPDTDLSSKAATSPALYNRCVLDWFGDWSDQAFYQVASEFTSTLDLDVASYTCPPLQDFPVAYQGLPSTPSHREAIINGFVYVHQSIRRLNKRLERQKGRSNFVTPRHYLDFIAHYVKVFTEKREELEEQQRHLNVGLDKLYATVEQVEELRKSLAVKRMQLEAKNSQANEKLQKMVADQQEAEQQKLASIELQDNLAKQNDAIAKRKHVVMADLAAAEPAVQDAQAAVSNIKKQHLTEVRSMANPPEAVKMAMESVCTILGHRIDSWRTVQGIIRRDDFISSIVNFDTNNMAPSLRRTMEAEYLSKPNFNFEVVNRASKACGPLVKWVIAQVGFSTILDRVGPLRQEVVSLEDKAVETQRQAETVVGMISDLESSIARYKDEYALLISETQAIKTEMETVARRVERSVKLLDSLESERSRWQDSSRAFDDSMSTVSGDVLLSAAFLAYGGYFDQQFRHDMLDTWTAHLAQANINFKEDLSLTEYLSTADMRLKWQTDLLPTDDLSTENAIILSRFNRYPLLIDPSGQATAFLLKHHQERKITVTSFLDEAFFKQLESALRFGTTLLIQDVEHLDPILNPVLNRELRRAGGRVLIRLGNQDIDFSPSFNLFLTTRDPSVDFPPDICSRVTFVNFTMTPASLRTQSLSAVLKSERPDVDKKRSDLLKLQGEFKLRLRHLERSLLQALNSSGSNILDDDKVIDTLETLKNEANDVMRKVDDTEVVMQEIEAITALYQSLAQACSAIYFALDQLAALNHFYQFSLRHFLDIFHSVLESIKTSQIQTPIERLQLLEKTLYTAVFSRTSRTLLHQDQLVLGMVLTQIKIQEQADHLELDMVLTGPSGAGLGSLSNLPYFEDLKTWLETDAGASLLSDSEPEQMEIPLWKDDADELRSLRALLLIKAVRPDRLVPAMSAFVSTVFGFDLLSTSSYSLRKVVLDETSGNTPIILCSVPGLDAAYLVDDLVAEMQVDGNRSQCSSVALGSQEGFSLSEKAIATAARQGSWVMLKNCHVRVCNLTGEYTDTEQLAPSWLSSLEKRLQSMPNSHPAFRLFLVMETTPSIPVSILRQSLILMNEPSPGLRTNVLELMASVPASMISSGPSEKNRIFFLLCWLHGVLVQRLRFVPLSFSKAYEFNDADFKAALTRLDTWINAAAKGKANLDPQNMPWQAMHFILQDYAMGGRVDASQDSLVLRSLVKQLFVPQSFDLHFNLTPTITDDKDHEAIRLEDESNWPTLQDFVYRKLPEIESPRVLGLPATASKVIAVREAGLLLSSLRKMRSVGDSETVGSGAILEDNTTPKWMARVVESCTSLLQLLPDHVETIKQEQTDDSIQRFLARELALLSSLIRVVRSDLTTVRSALSGLARQTNHTRDVTSALVKDQVPSAWTRFKSKSNIGLQEWFDNLRQRVSHLNMIATDGIGGGIWLGGLAFPAGLLTTFRQRAAQQQNVSIESLSLRISLDPQEGEQSGFLLRDLRLQCATPQGSLIVPNNGETVRVDRATVTWSVQQASGPKPLPTLHNTPLYLFSDRQDVLAIVPLQCEAVHRDVLVQAGAALLAGE